MIVIAKQYGFDAAILAYVLWDSRSRELRLLAVIQTLSEDVKGSLAKIEAFLWGRHS